MLKVKEVVSRAEQGLKPALPRLETQSLKIVEGEQYFRDRPLRQFMELVDYVASFFLDRFITHFYRSPLFGETDELLIAHRKQLSNAVQMSATYWLNGRSAYAFETLLPLMPALKRRLTEREASSFREKVVAIVMADFDALLACLADHEYEKAVAAGEGVFNLKHAVIPALHPEAFERGYSQTDRCVAYMMGDIRRLNHLTLVHEHLPDQDEIVKNLAIRSQRQQINLQAESVKDWMDVYREALMRGMSFADILSKYGYRRSSSS